MSLLPPEFSYCCQTQSCLPRKAGSTRAGNGLQKTHSSFNAKIINHTKGQDSYSKRDACDVLSAEASSSLHRSLFPVPSACSYKITTRTYYEKKPQFSSAGKVNLFHSCFIQMITSVRAVLLVLLLTPASASCAKVQGKTCWRSVSPAATRNTMDILELYGRWGKCSGTWGADQRGDG